MTEGPQPRLTLDIINTLVPEHSILRYQDKVICSDDKRVGGLRHEFADKEWRCKRCVLLDLLDDYPVPEWAQEAAVVLQVRYVGNVR